MTKFLLLIHYEDQYQRANLTIYIVELNKQMSKPLPDKSANCLNNMTEKMHRDREGRLMLICTGSGKIVFVHGDQNVLQIKNYQILHKNLFNLGFTQFSLLCLRKAYPNGIMKELINTDNPINLRMEIVRRKQIGQNSQERWKTNKMDMIKVIGLSCSHMKAIFSDLSIAYRSTEVIRSPVNIDPQVNQMQQNLVLVQVSGVTKPSFLGTHFKDYFYTCRKIKQMENLKMNDLQ